MSDMRTGTTTVTAAMNAATSPGLSPVRVIRPRAVNRLGTTAVVGPPPASSAGGDALTSSVMTVPPIIREGRMPRAATRDPQLAMMPRYPDLASLVEPGDRPPEPIDLLDLVTASVPGSVAGRIPDDHLAGAPRHIEVGSVLVLRSYDPANRAQLGQLVVVRQAGHPDRANDTPVRVAVTEAEPGVGSSPSDPPEVIYVVTAVVHRLAEPAVRSVPRIPTRAAAAPAGGSDERLR